MKKNNNHKQTYKVLEDQKHEPWEHRKDVNFDASKLTEDELSTIAAIVIDIVRWRKKVGKDVDYNKVRKYFDELLRVLAKATSLSAHKI